MILKICAKCSDLCDATLVSDTGKVLKETDGYVPSIMPEGGGDYVDIEIDIATGKILNWKVPTETQIKDFIAGLDGEDAEDCEECGTRHNLDDDCSLSQLVESNGSEKIEGWLCKVCGEAADALRPLKKYKYKGGKCDCCGDKSYLTLYRSK